MNRYATFLAAITLVTGFAALRTADEQPSSPEPVGVQEAMSEQQRVKNLLTQYRMFKGTFEATIESLRRGEITLKEASATMRAASTQYHPKYLKYLVLSDEGATIDERLARNLLGHVRTIEEVRPTQPSPLTSLNQELRELLAEIDR